MLALAGCGDDGDDGDSASAGDETASAAQGSCFYVCNLGGLTQYGCESSTDISDEDACYEAGRAVCGVNVGNTARVASCEGCDSSCAPDWYTP